MNVSPARGTVQELGTDPLCSMTITEERLNGRQVLRKEMTHGFSDPLGIRIRQ
jgi:hypothetical protein